MLNSKQFSTHFMNLGGYSYYYSYVSYSPGGGGSGSGTIAPAGGSERCETEYAPELEDEQWDSILEGLEIGSDEWFEVYGFENDQVKINGRKEVVPYVLAGLTAARWSVYWFTTPTGQRYVGISVDVGRRLQAHMDRGVQIAHSGIIQLGQKLNYAAAKGLEQMSIEAARRNGYSLLNKINSVAPTSPYYGQFTNVGRQIQKCSGSSIPNWMK